MILKSAISLLAMVCVNSNAQYSTQAELKNEAPEGALGEPHVITKRYLGTVTAVGDPKVPVIHGCIYFDRNGLMDLSRFIYIPVTVRVGAREIQTCHIGRQDEPTELHPKVGQKFHVITKEFTWGGGLSRN